MSNPGIEEKDYYTIALEQQVTKVVKVPKEGLRDKYEAVERLLDGNVGVVVHTSERNIKAYPIEEK